jgi:DNA gyrase/topoisomerase IV subunit B
MGIRLLEDQLINKIAAGEVIERPASIVKELVENSIDARATSVSITRGRSEGNHYLEIRDDGQGIPRDAEGRPDFRYVATHICDSVKRRLKVQGVSGLQGEFGIGLLSFWTLGEELTLTSTSADDRGWQMVMRKGDPGYTVKARRTLFAEPGTQLRINRLLEGIRSHSGEKIVVLRRGVARPHSSLRSADNSYRQNRSKAVCSRTATI